MTIKIATAQSFVSQDPSENGATIRDVITKAADQKARVVLFPEGALSGYAKSQVKSPADWQSFDWQALRRELKKTANLCKELGIFAVIGTAHPVAYDKHPYNSLFVISDQGELSGRYDKRFLSNSEVNDWYTPGTEPLVFSVDGYSFGCAICIEAVFPAVFSEYERLGVDAVLFASYGISSHFDKALRAYACIECLWIAAATPAQDSRLAPAFICDPNGDVVAQALRDRRDGLAFAVLDRDEPAYDIALAKARPWRRQARHGKIYEDKRNAASDY